MIVLRMLWVFPARYLLVRPGPDPDTGKTAAVARTRSSWAGPGCAAWSPSPPRSSSRRTPPHREVLLLIAFTVVAGTLLIQGLRCRWLARRLRVPAPDPMDDALARATLLQQASKAAFKRLEELELDDDPHGVVAT